MARGHAVVAEAEALVEIALLDPVQFSAQRPAFVHRAIEDFAADAAIHVLQHAGIGHAVQVTAELLRAGQLQVGQGEVRGG